MKKNMIEIENITIIKEDKFHIVYIQTLKGSVHFKISTVGAMRIQNSFRNDYHSLAANIISNSGISIDTFYLIQKNNHIISYLRVNGKKFISSLEETISLAIEFGAKLFIDQSLLQEEYQYSKEHEEEVDMLVLQSFEQEKKVHMNTLIEAITKAIEEERYEAAAILRDQILSIENNMAEK